MRIGVEYPEHIWNVRDIRETVNAGDKVGEILEAFCQELDDDLNVSTAQESGIARREKILDITPLDTENLEDRRMKVALKWYEKAPYTLPILIRRLDAVLGSDTYLLQVDYSAHTVTCYIELTRKAMFQSVEELLESLLPLDLNYAVKLRYNQNKDLNKYTYGQLTAYTHDMLRTDAGIK